MLRERLKGVQDIIHTMRQEYPEVLSFTIYGSMIKGTATLGSDIDGTLFIDTTPSGDEVLDKDISAAIQSGSYLDYLEYYLQHQLDLTPAQIGKDIKIAPISEHDVQSAASQYIADKENYHEERKVWESTKHDTGKTEKGLFGSEVPIYEYAGKEPKIPALPTNITAMFNMDIGGGIRTYRKKFLETLANLSPEQADDVCRDIMTYLSFTDEEKRDGQTKIPHTYEDFKRIYL